MNEELYKQKYLEFKEMLEDPELQLVVLDVLEYEYGWEGR